MDMSVRSLTGSMTRRAWTFSARPVSCSSGTQCIWDLGRLRLALRVLLKLGQNGLVLAAPDCSSWGIPARGTSLRNFVNSHGNLFLPWVRRSSTMVSRHLGPYG